LASIGVLRSKKIKILTRRPRHIETTDVPKLSESMETTPLAIETAPVVPIGTIADPTREPEPEKVAEKVPEQSKMKVIVLPKLPATTGTPRKRRMASVLEAVLEYVKTPPPSSTEASRSKTEDVPEMIIASTSAHAEAGPSEAVPENHMEESLLEKPLVPTPEASSQGDLDYIVRHASRKQLSEEQIAEVQHYAKDLKYPRGSLVYGGNDEDDFFYCLPDSKGINICREIMDNIGYPKLKLGLSAMLKDQLADSLAYNSLKVCIL
jgi:hypothetical protein